MNLNTGNSAFNKLYEFSFVKYLFGFCYPNTVIDTIENDPAEAVFRLKPDSDRNEELFKIEVFI